MPDAPGGILLVEEFPHLAKVLTGPARVLTEQHDVDVRMLATRSEVIPEVAGACPVHLLDDAVERSVRVRAADHARRVRRAVRRSEDVLGGIDAWRGRAQLVLDTVVPATANALGTSADAAVKLAAVVSAYRPGVVATSAYTGSPAQRAAVYAGRRAGAVSVHVQHGMAEGDAWKAHLLHDAHLVWGARSRRTLVALGAREAAVATTGSTKFEALLGRRSDERAAQGPVAYLAHRSGGYMVSEVLSRSMLADVVRTAAQVERPLVVKSHPDDRSDVFDQLTAEPHVTLRRTGDAVALMAEAAVVIVSTSTAGLEACALDRPVVVYAPDGVEPPPIYGEYGAAAVAADRASLEAALRELLDGGPLAEQLAAGRRRMIDDVFDGLRPGATQRVAEELRKAAAR
jgi:hypothetical protein